MQLERLLNNFTIDVADKILRGQLINEEKVKKEVHAALYCTLTYVLISYDAQEY
jgi:hypothetical protein